MLRTRLALGLLPFLLLIAGMGVYAIRTGRELSRRVSVELIAHYQDTLGCQHLRDAAQAMNNAVQVGLRGDPLTTQREFATQRAAFTRELMAQSARASGTPRAPLVARIDEEFQRLAQLDEAILRGGGATSREAMIQSADALYRLLDSVEAIARHDFASAQQTAVEASRLSAETTQVLVTVIIAAVLLAIILAWRMADALLAPIKALTSSAVALGDGDLEQRVPELSRDELGQLAQAFNQMGAKLRAYREATLAKVLRTQRTMEATLTSAPDPVFVIDRAGTHTVRNPAAEALASEPDFVDGLPAALETPLASVLSGGEHYLPTDLRNVITLRVGREDRHYLPRILAIGDALTEFKGAAIILQDVTKFRLLDDAKTNLVGTVSHELKTPLTSLRLAVYLLLEQQLKLTPTQRELLETARDDADRLLRILDNLLDLNRLEAGASTLDRQEIAVGELLTMMADEAKSLVETVGLKWQLSIAGGIADTRLSVDTARLRHVFMNLLTNAVKYSPTGGTVTLAAATDPLGYVRCAVRDEGGGIPAEVLPHVFDRFYRAPEQTKSGAGLGLAIAREIVVAHGGTIAVTSEPGQGTEFYFLLPV